MFDNLKEKHFITFCLHVDARFVYLVKREDFMVGAHNENEWATKQVKRQAKEGEVNKRTF